MRDERVGGARRVNAVPEERRRLEPAPERHEECEAERDDLRQSECENGATLTRPERTGLKGRQSHELPGIGNRERSKHERIEQTPQRRGRAKQPASA